MNEFIEGEMVLRDHDYYAGTLKAEWLQEDDEVDWVLRWTAYQGGQANTVIYHKEAIQLADKILEVSGKDLDEAQQNRITVAKQAERIEALERFVNGERRRSIRLRTAIGVALQQLDIDKIKIYLGQILDEEWS